MENVEMNRTAVDLIAQWDPFNLGAHSYDTETADVVAALQGINEASALAKVIREVYEHSFEQWIPMEKCEEMAQQLVLLKQQVACDL